ncbi:MAG TPA: hypothetical protein VFH76_15615, partial [Kribbella sp.]|nr:hypothetical protein [Kribbella sp.]
MRQPRTPLFAAAVLAATALCVPAAAAQPHPNEHSGKASNLVVESTTELGPITQNPHNAARDNGQSVRYGNQSVWFFDDTILKDPDGFLTSTAATTSDLDASDNITMTAANPFDE